MSEIGFGLSDLNPIKHVKKAAGGIVRSVGRVAHDPLRGAGTLANLLPGVAAAAAGAPALLVTKGAAELARHAGAPDTLTTFMDPSGSITHGVASGARAGVKAGGAAGLFKGALAGGVKGGKAITANPLIRATAAGLTFVIPPAGVALSGGLAALDKGLGVADKLVGAMEYGGAPVKAAVANVYARTTALAKSGDADAKRALLVLSAAKTKLEVSRSHTYLVTPNGTISRGTFSKVAAGTAGARAGFYVRADGHVERGTFKAG